MRAPDIVNLVSYFLHLLAMPEELGIEYIPHLGWLEPRSQSRLHVLVPFVNV